MARQTAAPPLRVLVVDDHPEVAESMALILRLWGHQVQVAYEGTTALEAARSYQPQVVFLDIGLPGMDGYQVARHLRGALGLARSLIVAVTGYGSEDDRRRSREAGFDVHLVKPVDPLEVQGLLQLPPP